MVGLNFDRGVFSETTFDYAFLNDASFIDANLNACRFFNTNAIRTDFTRAKLHEAEFRCDLEARKPSMGRGDLDEAQFVDCSFCETKFYGSQLNRSRFRRTGGPKDANRLQFDKDTWLKGALWEGQGFLHGVTFHTNEESAKGLALRDMQIGAGDFEASTLDVMFADGSVSLPQDVDRPSHWVFAVLDEKDFHDEWRKWLANPNTYTPPE